MASTNTDTTRPRHVGTVSNLSFISRYSSLSSNFNFKILCIVPTVWIYVLRLIHTVNRDYFHNRRQPQRFPLATNCVWCKEVLKFEARSQNREKRLLALSCSTVRMEQLGSHWTDYLEIGCLNIFSKSVEKILVLLKSDQNKGYFTWKHLLIYDDISLYSP